MRPVRTAKFRGHVWKVVHKAASVVARTADAEAKKLGEAKPERVAGLTDGLKVKKKEMWISKSLSGVKLLDTYIHEAMHCCLWDTSEEAVHESATDIARFLWRLG